MNQRRCKDCKWWSRGNGLFRECNAVEHDYKCFSYGTDVEQDNLAVVVDGRGEFARFRSKAEFYCAYWEGKEAS